MKGDPNPKYSRRQVRKEIARRMKAENQVAQLQRMLDELSKSEITKWRKLQAEILYTPSGRNVVK